ncbi:MAG: hypothetical protein FJ143_11210 [Deltaproteobacteria bacterium]|nr:hypothetical protein [Deltaproteobacteria bacterium]
MRFFFKILFLLIVLSPLALGALLYLAVETEPTVASRATAITPASVERAKRTLTQNDPRKLKSGERRTVATNAADLDLAANYLAQQYARGSARVRLRSGGLESAVSVRAPLIPMPLYLNLSMALSDQESATRLETLRVGQLPVPVWLAEWLLPRLLPMANPDFDYRVFMNAVKKVDTNETRMAVTYEWQAELGDKLRALVLPLAEQERLRVYHDRLVEVSKALPAKNISLTELLVPLGKLAAERSVKNPAPTENRAVLLILTIYVNGRSLEKLIPEAKNWPKPTKHSVRLNQRDDFPKHFIISAALAANAGGPLADAVGLYKEIEDSRGGSGFSFNDIAADRAGVKFGEHAAHNANAGLVQKKLSKGISERDIMPVTTDLPEFMQDAEFQRRFGGIDGAEYKKMMAEIDRRIAALPLYR